MRQAMKGEGMIPAYLTESRDLLENISRQYCQTARINDRAVLCRVLSKYIFYADADDIGLTPHLCLDGFWESWVTLAMARILKRGWHCLDVGANQGYFTLLMADAVEDEGRVLAIEPNPRLLERLNLSLEVNGFCHRASVTQKAVYNTSGARLQLRVPPNRAMDATVIEDASGEGVEVETVTIDDLTRDWRRIDLIKIDAEGAEEKIWQGMGETIKRHRQLTIIMEMRCSRYADPRRFVRRIRDSGFPLRHIEYDGSVHEVSEAQVLGERPHADWMLFLSRT
jgi:FkbM family methyltransferase